MLLCCGLNETVLVNSHNISCELCELVFLLVCWVQVELLKVIGCDVELVQD